MLILAAVVVVALLVWRRPKRVTQPWLYALGVIVAVVVIGLVGVLLVSNPHLTPNGSTSGVGAQP